MELPAPPRRHPDADSGAAPPSDAGADDAAEDAPLPPSDADDAGITPVVIGITPTPRSDREGGPTAGDRLAAELTTLAAGVRGVVVSRHPRELDDDAYASLTRLNSLYAQHHKQVLFNLALVDHAADGRPDALTGLAWDDPAVIEAVQSAIDAVFTRFNGTLAYFTFGLDTDVYLAGHPAERDAFGRLATQACAHALASPTAPPDLHVGVGLSFDTDPPSDPIFDALLAAGDVTVLSYFPGLSGGQATPTSDVTDALDAMVRRSPGRPIVLQSVGYPSAAAAGSSEEKQRLFFATFFDALGPRRSAFAFVNVAELHDLSPAACRAYAESQGAPSTGAFASFACSLGLFGQGEASRPAWMEVLGGVATFASP